MEKEKNELSKIDSDSVEHSAPVQGCHYDFKPVKETIELIEQIMQRESIPPMARYCIATALKYILRLGVKSSKWEEDASKAENYLHRAITGGWMAKN